MVKMIGIFRQAAAPVVFAVVAVGRFKEVADGVGSAVYRAYLMVVFLNRPIFVYL
jgi:hypothetical protein